MRLYSAILLSIYACGAHAASCPVGYVLIDVPDVSVVDACPADSVSVGDAEPCAGEDSSGVCWVVERMRSLCTAGITQLNMSTDVSIPLYSDKSTSPSLHILYNDTVCYADAVSGIDIDTINIRVPDGAIYHLVK